MKNLTLLIPAKNEKESLPQVIDEIKNLDCKKKVILSPDDIDTINAIKNLNVDIIYQNNHQCSYSHFMTFILKLS